MIHTEDVKKLALQYDFDEACRFLNREFPFRDSGKELQRLIDEKGIDKSVFKDESDKANLRNWLNGKNISRESAIFLCFALHLTVEEASVFIQKTCANNWFYMRDYKDIIYFYNLKSGSYESALKSIEDLKHLDRYNTDAPDKYNDTTLTHYLSREFNSISSPEDLSNFLDEHKECFGSFNRTAHRYFSEFINQLVSDYETSEKIDVQVKKERNIAENNYKRDKISLSEVANEICMRFPSKNRRNGVSLIQKIVFSGEIGHSTLSEILNKYVNKKGAATQVSRSTLILAFLLVDENENFENSVMTLNDILLDCGMPRLDSKNPFDWVVMSSLNTESPPEHIEKIKNYFLETYTP